MLCSAAGRGQFAAEKVGRAYAQQRYAKAHVGWLGAGRRAFWCASCGGDGEDTAGKGDMGDRDVAHFWRFHFVWNWNLDTKFQRKCRLRIIVLLTLAVEL